MTKFSMKKGLFAIILMSLLVLAACGGDSGDAMFSIDDFDNVKTNEGEATGGGHLNFGLVSDTPFEGTLNYNFYSGNPDVQIIDWFNESLLAIDENYNYTQEGAATFEVDEDTNSFTFTINENLNWHDGEPVTAEDWAYAYEVVGHPDYDGVRYTQALSSVEGMPEYHAGEADEISGLEIIDEKTLKITYHDFTPSLLSSGIWAYPLAKHIFEEIPIEDMASSDAVRQEPIGYGPYIVDSIVPGESVTYVKNEDYWRGEPQLDGLTVQVINPNVVVQALQTGQVDVVSSFPAEQYADNHEMSNVEFLGMVDNAYTYIGFKLGHWDADLGEVVMDPDSKVADVNLRRAMWYAVDNDSIGSEFYDGLRWAGTTLIPPSHPDYHDDSIEVPTYDPDKANEILDEAGYLYLDEDDQFRADPDGNELVLNFASMSGGDTAEPIATYYMQAWAEVGINVQLLDGRLQEFNTFYDRVEADDPDIDVYQGAWSVGSDVDPSGLYGRTAAFNYPRFASEENDRLLAEGLSDDAFDTEYRKDVYSEWQELMVEEIPVFPTVYRSLIVPVNNRVTNYAIGAGTGVYRYEIGVTQDEPFEAEEITPVEDEEVEEDEDEE